jgi:hypothetical protein
LEGEQLIGGVASNFLRRGRWSYPGYGIYATNKRIIGIKMRKGIAVMVLVRGIPGIFVGQAVTKVESNKTLRELEEKKDIEITRDEISWMKITKPGVFKGGRLKIMRKSGSDIEFVIGGKKEFESIRDLMKAFFPSALKAQE